MTPIAVLCLGLALAVAPAPGAPLPTPPLPWAAHAAVRRWAVANEWVDPRENNYLFARECDWAVDWRILRTRRCELEDAPPLRDATRFPDTALCTAYLAFNRDYRGHLEARARLGPCGWWDRHESTREAARLYEIWDLARDAGCEHYYVQTRRGALLRLRRALGEDAYWSGRLPPPVPVWRFQRIR